MILTRPGLLLLAAGILMVFCAIAEAQSSPSPTIPPPPRSAEGDDSDPTRPVVWSFRQEYYNLSQSAWSNAFLLRVDRAFLPNRPAIAGKRGILTRFDVPVVVAGRPDGTNAGLGDIYWQALWVPYLTREFAFAGGSGISLPTATSRQLGTGKLTVAPAVVPVWFIPQRGLAFIKVQDYISVAGANDRSDLHYLTITPLLVWRLGDKPWWIQFDGETRTDWNSGAHTGYKAGFLLGRMTRKRLGAWFKVEIGMGPYRTASVAIKTSVFKVH